MTIKSKSLNKRIDELKLKRKIKIENNKFINVGLLLEKELGIIQNDFSVADFDGIELKVSRITSNLPITLFSCTCDGPDVFELNRLVNRFGAYDCVYKSTKVLYIKLSANEYAFWGKFIKMRLEIDRNNKKIFIIVTDNNSRIIEKRAFWNFSTLDDVLNRKLNCLCFVSYNIKYHSNQKYCYFETFNYLQCMGLERFLDLIECGDIKISIKYGVYKKGNNKGKSYNHGTSFEIKKNALYKLFEQI